MAGPDFIFQAAFLPTNALADAVRSFDFQHFSHYALQDHYCRQHGQTCSYDIYVDRQNAERLIGNLEGRHNENIWVYHSIEVCGGSLSIERGYGGYGDPFAAEERALLRWLNEQPQLALQSWQILTGGDGYAYTERAAGSSSAKLLDYFKSSGD